MSFMPAANAAVAMQNELDVQETSEKDQSGSDSTLIGALQASPVQVAVERKPTTSQKDAEEQETWPALTPLGGAGRHELPLYLNASPEPPTAMQNELDGQDTEARNDAGCNGIGALHEPPLNTSADSESMATQNEDEAHETWKSPWVVSIWTGAAHLPAE